MRPLAASMPAITRAALGKKGFALASLLTEWEAIVGPGLAGYAMPLRLAKPRDESLGATLEIRVEGAAALELQHSEPRVIERINAHFGYAAVSRLKLRQGPVGTGGASGLGRSCWIGCQPSRATGCRGPAPAAALPSRAESGPSTARGGIPLERAG